MQLKSQKFMIFKIWFNRISYMYHIKWSILYVHLIWLGLLRTVIYGNSIRQKLNQFGQFVNWTQTWTLETIRVSSRKLFTLVKLCSWILACNLCENNRLKWPNIILDHNDGCNIWMIITLGSKMIKHSISYYTIHIHYLIQGSKWESILNSYS